MNKQNKQRYPKPAESVIVYTDSSFPTLGMEFDPQADYAGCRLCGKVYQSHLDREVRFFVQSGDLQVRKNPLTAEVYLVGDERFLKVYHEAHDRRQKWRELHAKRTHTQAQVENFTSTGFALTPEAAHKLAPYGFAPAGNLHPDITAAMLEAPRAPEEDAEN
jgi:hypothetical protein